MKKQACGTKKISFDCEVRIEMFFLSLMSLFAITRLVTRGIDLSIQTSHSWKILFSCTPDRVLGILTRFNIAYCPPIFTLDLPYMHEYITRSLHSIFNHRKDIVYRRSSSILISVIRISHRKITIYECPFNIQRRLGLEVTYVAIIVKVSGSSLGKLFLS